MGIIGFHNLNLAIRADRKNICIGNYDSREISPSDVTFHVAPYGRDYKNSHDMCDAAIADGYPIFDQLREYPLGDLGYLWGTTKILETIRDDNAHPFGYYNQDDKLLQLSYPQLESICCTLQNSFVDPFLFLQMSWYAPPNCGISRPKTPILPTSKICKGALGTGDSGLLMSREGADFLLSEWEKAPQIYEVLIGKFWDIPGIYSIEKTAMAIKSVDTRWFGHEQWIDDQDRIKINRGE